MIIQLLKGLALNCGLRKIGEIIDLSHPSNANLSLDGFIKGEHFIELAIQEKLKDSPKKIKDE